MNRVWSSTRWKFAAHIAARHALLSLIIAVLAALWIFKGWYPAPFGEMLGVSTLVAVLIAVDVVCGPLLNFYLSNPTKTRRALLVDWTAVGVIQLGAGGLAGCALGNALLLGSVRHSACGLRSCRGRKVLGSRCRRAFFLRNRCT